MREGRAHEREGEMAGTTTSSLRSMSKLLEQYGCGPRSRGHDMTTALADAQRPERLNPTAGTGQGSSSPLGAILSGGGVNFSVYSSHATGVELLLFDHVDDAGAARVIRIDPADNRTYHYWHV